MNAFLWIPNIKYFIIRVLYSLMEKIFSFLPSSMYLSILCIHVIIILMLHFLFVIIFLSTKILLKHSNFYFHLLFSFLSSSVSSLPSTRAQKDEKRYFLFYTRDDFVLLHLFVLCHIIWNLSKFLLIYLVSCHVLSATSCCAWINVDVEILGENERK